VDPIDQLVLVLSVGLLTLAAFGAGLAAAWHSRRRQSDAVPITRTGATGALPLPDDPSSPQDGELDAPRHSVRERVIRVVALCYLVAVAVVVAVSGAWGDAAAIIYVLVALGTLAVVFLGDLVPDSVPAAVRGWAEGAVAIVLVSAIVGLTDGVTSPFATGYLLIVGAAALSRDPLAPVFVALTAAFSAGAVDLVVASRGGQPLTAPVIAGVVMLAVGLLLLATIVSVASREHRRALEATMRLARFDPLTGLYNRTHFFAELEREIRLSQRAGRTFALLMIDVDGLKPVNDAFGHHYGDRLLTGLTSVIRATVRATDTPARYGGDEFVVLLPDTDAAGAYVVAEKLRHDISGFSIQVSDRTVRTSVSLGLVSYPDDGTTADALMAAADSALYEAKRTGRDRIVGYTTRMERVATAMGATEPRAAATMARDQPPSPAPAPSSAAGTVVAAGQAPWETGTNADWETRGRARVAVPVGPDDEAGSTGRSGRPV
jgi:diguanylate cyclase (GGDEF)-like protein